MTSIITSNLIQMQSSFNKTMDRMGVFLDEHPTIYKAALVACHLFRTYPMYGMMLYSPVATGTLFLTSSLLYRAAVERFCIFRFTLPSMAGGVSLWIAKATVTSLLAQGSFYSLGTFLTGSLGFLPLVAYTIFICKTSHDDIENLLKKKNCCCT